jgi:hypothetical protein
MAISRETGSLRGGAGEGDGMMMMNGQCHPSTIETKF